MKKRLLIDIETRSGADITECGHYRYAQDDDFEILLFGYRMDGMEEAKVIDLKQGEEIPSDLKVALTNPNYVKIAHNAAF
jgi:DNA polymerase